MKKLVLSIVFGIVTLGSVACTNPSMEEGLEGLSDALAQLEQAIADLNIAQMQADLEQMNIDAAQMLYDLEDAEGSWAELIGQLDYIHQQLVAINETAQNWATSEQMQDLLADIQQVGEGVDLLVLRADYDYDGVINAIDQCPNTPLSEINNVDSKGCAPDETPETNG